jgi:hypothetical protein
VLEYRGLWNAVAIELALSGPKNVYNVQLTIYCPANYIVHASSLPHD